MATNFSNALKPSGSDTPQLRAWAQFVEDTFVSTGGWVVTTDTGQTLPSALVGNVASNFKIGYRIYRMSDTLQATNPVFLRIDYGTGNGPTTCAPSIWVTIGTGSNGAGTITGALLSNIQISTLIAGYSFTLINNSYGSAFHDRCCFALFVQNQQQYPLLFGIERTRDALGVPTGDGLLLAYSSFNSNPVFFQYSQYLRLAVGTQPTLEIGLTYILTGNNPSDIFAPGDVGLGILIHFNGSSQQPGLNWMFCNSNDVSAEGNLSTQLYGHMRTYQQLNNCAMLVKSLAGSGTGTQDANARILMRYD